MNYCSNCGNKLEEGARICPHCLTLVEEEPVSQEIPHPSDTPNPSEAPHPEGSAPYAPYAPAYAYVPAPPRDEKATLAIVGFILGIVGVLCCCVPVFPVLVAIAGLVLSILGLKSTTQKGLAIAGIVISSLGLVLSIAALCVIIFSGRLNVYSTSPEFNEYFNDYFSEYFQNRIR